MEHHLNIIGLMAVKEAANGASAIARAIGISPQAVAQWKAVPAEHVLRLERAFGVSRHRQRPDIFGPADAEPPE